MKQAPKVLGLMIASALIFSCQKKDVKKSNQVDQSTENSMEKSGIRYSSNGKYLVFPTTADYDYFSNIANYDGDTYVALIDELKTYSYKSYLERIENLNETSIYDDQFMETIVNEDLIVQIGDYLYRVDATEKKVYVLPAAKSSAYADLVSESKTNEYVRKFSFDDDVIELAESGAAGEAKCGDPTAANTSATSASISFGLSKTMYISNEYKKYGVYFVLRTDFYHSTAFSPSYKFYFQLDNCSWAQRCGSSTSGYSHPWRVADSKHTVNGSTQRETFKCYSGMKKLKSFTYKARGRCEDFTTPSSPNPYSIIFTEYKTITG